jgi:hypothetical protein
MSVPSSAFEYGPMPAVEVAALRAQAQRIRKSNR